MTEKRQKQKSKNVKIFFFYKRILWWFLSNCFFKQIHWIKDINKSVNELLFVSNKHFSKTKKKVSHFYSKNFDQNWVYLNILLQTFNMFASECLIL